MNTSPRTPNRNHKDHILHKETISLEDALCALCALTSGQVAANFGKVLRIVIADPALLELTKASRRLRMPGEKTI